MNISISESAIQNAVASAITSHVRDSLVNRWGDTKLQAIVKAEVDASEEVVKAAVRRAIVSACDSPQMQAGIAKVITDEVANKARGSFEAVIHAAAKALSNEPEVKLAMMEVARSAITGAKA